MTDTIPTDATPSRADDVLATDSQDLTVLMSMDTGKFVELNATARAVWDLTDGKHTIAHIVETLAERFDVTRERCRDDVVTLFTQLREEGLVVLGS